MFKVQRLHGIYQSITVFISENLFSGLMYTINRVTTRDMSTLCSLKPGYHKFLWQGLYQTIARANGAGSKYSFQSTNKG